MSRNGIVVVGAIAGAIGSFLPWVSAFGVLSVNGIDGGDGWITLALFAGALIAALGGKLRLAGGLGLAAGLLGIYEIVNVKKELGALSGLAPIGSGLYLIVGAGLVIAALGFAGKRT